jgi:hypothetical protein
MKSRVLVAAAVVAVLAGCSPSGTGTSSSTLSAAPVTTPVTATFLASLTETGGMCPDGACLASFAVSSDGTWNLVSSTANRSGALPADVLAALTTAATTTSLLDAPAFTGTCPTAYDGSEMVYSWRDSSGATQTVSACDKAVPDTDPLVTALEQAESAAGIASGDGSSAAPADDIAGQAAKTSAIAQSVVGMAEADAEATIAGVSSVKLTSRIVERDGVSLPATQDYSPQRINLTIEDGRVTAVSVG